MPASYPGQEWRHGWIPMTGASAKSKNHGRKPGKNSAIARAAADAGAVLNRMKAQDAAKKSGAKPASRGDAKPSWPAGKGASKPSGKAADKPTPGDKADAAKPKMGWPKGGDKAAAKTPAKPAAKAAPPKAAAKTPAKQDAPKGDAAAPKGGGTVSDAAAKQHVLAAVGDIMPSEGKWASMTALRGKLGDMPRDQQDRVLLDLMVAGKVDLEPVAIYGDLKPADRAAEITVGRTPNHQVRLSAGSMPSSPKPSPAGEKPAAKPKIGWPSKPGDKPAEPKATPRAAGRHAAKTPAAH